MKRILMVAAPVALLALAPAAARTAQPSATSATSAQVQRLLACRAVADPAARVQCFDREALAFDQAIQRKQLVVVDRAVANATRRSLFGFSTPSLRNLFGGGDDDVREVQGIVARANYRGPSEGWTIALADGSVWAQTDDSPVALAPRKGNKILIRRTALGGYALSIAGQPAVKVRRIA